MTIPILNCKKHYGIHFDRNFTIYFILNIFFQTFLKEEEITQVNGT